MEAVSENDKVTFETERGQKGLNAIKVKKTAK
jgi:cold shock CspA family protein